MYIDKLNLILDDKDLTISKLAEDIHIERSVLGKYLSGYLVIPLKHLVTLANYFHLSIDYLFSLSNFNNNVDYIDINMKILSKRLKEFRNEKKLSQSKLGKEIGGYHSTISDYEKSKRIITTSHLYSLCSKYRISADYLLGRTNEPKYLK